MIFIDQIVEHATGSHTHGSGDDTAPAGITGDSWCHVVSTTSLTELQTFLTSNLSTIQCPPENIRTPSLGSRQTYAGLNNTQRTAAIAAGAVPKRQVTTATAGFDSPDTAPFYEP